MIQFGDHRGVDKGTVTSRLFNLSSTTAPPLKLLRSEAPLYTVQTRMTWLILKSIMEQGTLSSIATNASPFLFPFPPHVLCVW